MPEQNDNSGPFDPHVVADAIRWLVDEGHISADDVIWPADLEGTAAKRAEVAQAKGWWRSPGITLHCAECGREFTIHVYTESTPTPADTGKRLPIQDSEGGVVTFRPWIDVTPLGPSYDWIAVCDVCSPV